MGNDNIRVSFLYLPRVAFARERIAAATCGGLCANARVPRASFLTLGRRITNNQLRLIEGTLQSRITLLYISARLFTKFSPQFGWGIVAFL